MRKAHRNDYTDTNLYTVNQLKKLKMVPKEGCIPKRLWSNHHHNGTYSYYLLEQARPMTTAELELLKMERRQSYLKRKHRLEERERSRREEEKQHCQSLITEAEEKQRYIVGSKLGRELVKQAYRLPAIPCDNPSKTIVIDTETTGLSCIYDEILQLSIIDGEGNVLFNEYIQPYYKETWDDAERINGIKKETVSNAKFLHEFIPRLRGILETTEHIVGYNVAFDLDFLKEKGIIIINKEITDVMTIFAEYYGEWDVNRECYRWQSLEKCATYFKYKFSPHDSLEDVKATLFCYKKLLQLNDSTH